VSRPVIALLQSLVLTVEARALIVYQQPRFMLFVGLSPSFQCEHLAGADCYGGANANNAVSVRERHPGLSAGLGAALMYMLEFCMIVQDLSQKLAFANDGQ
jgi:hypothetical protein